MAFFGNSLFLVFVEFDIYYYTKLKFSIIERTKKPIGVNLSLVFK